MPEISAMPSDVHTLCKTLAPQPATKAYSAWRKSGHTMPRPMPGLALTHWAPHPFSVYMPTVEHC